MKYIRFIILLFSIFLANIVFPYQIIYKESPIQVLSDIQVSTEKDIYQAGEDLKILVTIRYFDKYIIPNASLTIHIVKKEDDNPLYPSDKTSSYYIYEKSEFFSLYPNEEKNITFTWKIPYDIKHGEYYIVTYLHSPVAYMNGAPYIFLPGKTIKIKIENKEKGEYPWIIIDKINTKINLMEGQYGAPTNDTLLINLNLVSEKDTKANIIAYLARWDTIFYKRSILLNETIDISKGFNSYSFYTKIEKLKSDAYDILIEVYSEGRLQNIYRLRFIKLGPTAVLQNLLLDENGNLIAVIGPSPDHYTYPTTENVKVYLYSDDLQLKREYYIGNLQAYTTGFAYIYDKINLTKNNFKLCLDIFSNNLKTYSNCFLYKLSENPFNIISNNSNILFISNKAGTLIINQSGKIIIYEITPGESINLKDFYENSEIKFITNDGKEYKIENISIYKEEIYENKQTYKTSNILWDNQYLLYIALIIGITIVIFMIWKIRKKLWILILLSILWIPIKADIVVDKTTLCSPYGNITIVSNYTFNDYKMLINLYYLNYKNNFTVNCNKNPCNYTLTLTNLYPNTNISLNIKIEKGNEIKDEKNFNISIIYPYNVYILYPTIEKGAYSAAKVLVNCNYLNNYQNTKFNFTTNNGFVIRIDCPYYGDPDWGENICQLYTSNLDIGTYRINVSYIFNNTFYNYTIGEINIIQSTGLWTSQSCGHGWSAQSNINFLLNILYTKENATEDGYIVIPINSTIGFSRESIIFLCSNAHTTTNYPNIVGWVYEKDRGFLYGKDSKNPADYINNSYGDIRREIYTTKSMEGLKKFAGMGNKDFYLDNFTQPGIYTIYLDMVNMYCDSPTLYVCPASPSSTLCKIGVTNQSYQYIGWIKEIKNLSIIVAWPNAVSNLYNIEVYPYRENNEIRVVGRILETGQTFDSPVSKVIVGQVENTGYGSIAVDVNTTQNYRQIIKMNKISYVYANLSDIIGNDYEEKTINYNVGYRDAYGFSNYPYYYLGNGSISLKKNRIEILDIYGNLEFSKQSYLYIKVRNLGLSKAQVKVIPIEFDQKCLLAYESQEYNIEPNREEYLALPIYVYSATCENYTIKVEVSGWNTESKTVEIILPFSAILYPSSGSVIKDITYLKVRDVNANICKININGLETTRECNKDILFNPTRCTATCEISVSSENNNIRFIYPFRVIIVNTIMGISGSGVYTTGGGGGETVTVSEKIIIPIILLLIIIGLLVL